MLCFPLFPIRRCSPPELGLAECYGVPLPTDLKIPPESISPWRGGESEGLQRLEQHLADQVHPADMGLCGWAEVGAIQWRVVGAGLQETSWPRPPVRAEDLPSKHLHLRILLFLMGGWWSEYFPHACCTCINQQPTSHPCPLTGRFSPCSASSLISVLISGLGGEFHQTKNSPEFTASKHHRPEPLFQHGLPVSPQLLL